jgi:hypothetical protein
MKTDKDDPREHPLPWSLVAKVWNEREGDNLKPHNVKEIGVQALRKLRERLVESGRTLEDLLHK